MHVHQSSHTSHILSVKNEIFAEQGVEAQREDTFFLPVFVHQELFPCKVSADFIFKILVQTYLSTMSIIFPSCYNFSLKLYVLINILRPSLLDLLTLYHFCFCYLPTKGGISTVSLLLFFTRAVDWIWLSGFSRNCSCSLSLWKMLACCLIFELQHWYILEGLYFPLIFLQVSSNYFLAVNVL